VTEDDDAYLSAVMADAEARTSTPAPDPALSFRESVEAEKERIRIRDTARAELRAEGLQAMPDDVDLDDLLAEPDEDVTYRVARLWPKGGNVMFSAQFKSGKTTARDNLVRCLVDGTPFLGRFAVEQVTDGRVYVIDTEMPRATLRGWLRAHQFVHPGRVRLAPIRGAQGTFDMLNPDRRDEWAKRIREAEAEVVILDCLGPVLAALGVEENDNTGVGRFLVEFERMLDDAGVAEALVVHHMGHAGERSRGASRLRDWPDAEWRLIKQGGEQGEEAAGDTPRFFAAIGRDVSEPEQRLTYDPRTRSLTIGTGNRRTEKARECADDVLAHLAANPGQSGRQIEAALTASIPRDTIRAALKLLVDEERACSHPGKGGGSSYRIPTQCAECAGVRGDQHPRGGNECAGARGVYNPRAAAHHPGTRDDNGLRMTTRCARCGEPMVVFEPGQTTHPGCDATEGTAA